jgi:hypothetical protein
VSPTPFLNARFGYTDDDENAPAGFTTAGRNHSPVNI